MTGEEMVEHLVQQVGCPLPCMGHDETRRTYREILDVIADVDQDQQPAEDARVAELQARMGDLRKQLEAESAAFYLLRDERDHLASQVAGRNETIQRVRDVTLQANEKVGLLRPVQILRAIDGEASNA